MSRSFNSENASSQCLYNTTDKVDFDFTTLVLPSFFPLMSACNGAAISAKPAMSRDAMGHERSLKGV